MSTPSFIIQDIHKAGKRVETTFRFGAQTHQVFVESDDFDLVPKREMAVALSLYAGMLNNADLEINGSISPRVLAAIPHIQDFYHCWEPSFKHITLRNVQAGAPAGERAKRVALFFSGGLDCWYSLLKSQAEITDIIYI